MVSLLPFCGLIVHDRWIDVCFVGVTVQCWSTENRHIACAHGVPTLGGHPKHQNAPGFIKLRQGLTQPGVVGIDFIKDAVELWVLKYECGKEAGYGHFLGKNHSGVRIFRS